VYTHILVPLDGTPQAELVLPHVEALVERFGAALTLVEATPTPADLALADASAGGMPVAPPLIDPTQVADAAAAEADDYLGRVVTRLRGRGFRVERAVAEGSPADAIIAHAERIKADLIAMSTHGRGGVGRLVFGSVAEDVLHHAPCPMLLVRVDE
jgi:nucleotide-binding universal stress UspA family protein